MFHDPRSFPVFPFRPIPAMWRTILRDPQFWIPVAVLIGGLFVLRIVAR